ncbi:hypothetical protein [Paenibacillus polymyxa]|uniref:hypothetical protein n=1 Tax=Paenibacillus polymyxa TaxID=1406 RepID=UPI00202448D4|nr:hypothetical protein [Paenibacillus polymyxa]URJ60917.3 hypothetical protein MF622_000584 [Paenibacillus polymyxa]
MQQFIIEQIHHILTWAAGVDWNWVLITLFDWLKKAKIILDLIPYVTRHIVDKSPKGYRTHLGTAKRGRKRCSSYRRRKVMRKR